MPWPDVIQQKWDIRISLYGENKVMLKVRLTEKDITSLTKTVQESQSSQWLQSKQWTDIFGRRSGKFRVSKNEIQLEAIKCIVYFHEVLTVV